MTKIAATIFVFTVFGLCLCAQEEEAARRKNAVYLEILGNGVVYSFNYERLFPVSENLAPFIRLGGNIMPSDTMDTTSPYFVSEAGIIFGRQKNFFDTSIGYTQSLDNVAKDRFIVIRAGFRYSGPKGFLLRLSPMYVFNTLKGDVFKGFWLGVAAGYSF